MTEENTSGPKLPRTLSIFGAFALAFGGIVGWGAFVMPGTTFLPKAGPLGTAISLGLGAAIMIIVACNFSYMIRKFPQTGGAFVFAREAFGRHHGYACAWFLSLAYVTLVAQNGTALSLISSNLMGGAAEFGFSYDLAGYSVYAGDVIIPVVVIGLLGLLAVRSSKIAYHLQSVLVICIIAALAIIAVTAVANPQVSAERLNPPFNPEQPTLLGMFAVLAAAPFAFVGFDAVSQLAGEYTFNVRKVGVIMVLAIICGALTYVSLNAIAAAGTPAAYASWVEYIDSISDLQGIASMPVFNAVYTALGPAGLVILDVATLGAVLSGIVGFYLASSRLLYAMASEGVIPPWFGKLHPKYHTPSNAILFVFIVSTLASLLGRTILGWIVDMTSVGAALSFLYTSAATYKLAKEDGKRATSAVGVAGFVLSCIFILLLLVPIPQVGASLSMESIVFLVAWIVLGLNFYAPKASERKRMSIGDRLTAIDSETE